MIVKDLYVILGNIPTDFEVRVVGLFSKPYSLDHYLISDINVSYLNKTVLILFKYPEDFNK